MRPTLRIAAWFAALSPLLLAGCATAPDAPSKAIAQRGILKVHPGLLGQEVPPELQAQEAPAAARAPDQTLTGDAKKMEPASLPTGRSIYFDLDSADLKAEFITLLQAHAHYLLQHPDHGVRVEGHADERGSADHNRKLGLKRAEAVKQSLLGQGVADSQVRISSLGEARPRQKGHDEESWAENRRADLRHEK